MEALIPGPLQSSNPKILQRGLYKILSGISEELGLKQSQIAKILHRPKATVSDWLNNHEVKVSKAKYSPDDVQIYELIELYDSLTSYFVRVEDINVWLHRPNIAFGNVSPLEYIYAHPSHLRDVRKFLELRMSP